MSKMYQVELVQKPSLNALEAYAEGSVTLSIRRMTTWLPVDSRLKRGTNVKLKDEEGWWIVTLIHDSNIQDLKEVTANRAWDNNNYDRHKGLGL